MLGMAKRPRGRPLAHAYDRLTTALGQGSNPDVQGGGVSLSLTHAEYLHEACDASPEQEFHATGDQRSSRELGPTAVLW